jgi:hypothetical protein
MRSNGREAATDTSDGRRPVGFAYPVRPGLLRYVPTAAATQGVFPIAPLLRSGAGGHQAPEIWPPQQPACDRGTAGYADPALEARNGAAVDAMEWPLRLLVVAQDPTMRRQMIDYLESHDMRAISADIRPETLRHLAASEPDLMRSRDDGSRRTSVPRSLERARLRLRRHPLFAYARPNTS